jgi:hypothetical protein
MHLFDEHVKEVYFFFQWRLVRRLISLALKTGTFAALNAAVLMVTYVTDKESNGTHPNHIPFG